MLRALPLGTPLYHPSTLTLEAEHITWLRKFQRHFVVTFVDKLSSSYAFVCVKRAAKILIEDLLNNDIYTRILGTTDIQIFDALHVKLDEHGLILTPRNRVLPPYVMTYKAHSNKYRMIVAANKAPMDSAYTAVTWLFKSMTPYLKRVWNTLFAHIPDHLTPPFVILKNADEFVNIMKAYNIVDMESQFDWVRQGLQDLHSPQFESFDFDRLYTGLPHDDLIQQLTTLVTEFFGHHPGAPFLRAYHNGKQQWSAQHPSPHNINMFSDAGGRCFVFTLRRAIQLITLVIRSTYFQFAGAIFHQTLGIPMGASPCVYIANLYLFSYELAFYRRIMFVLASGVFSAASKLFARKLLLTYRFMGRYIDDTGALTHNPTLFHDFLHNTAERYGMHGIYPHFLGFKVTSLPNRREMIMLNVHLTLVGPGYSIFDTVVTGVYRKDSAFFNYRAKPLRLPDPHSLIPDKYKFGVIRSQIIAHHRLCNTREAFIDAVIHLVRAFEGRGYYFPKVFGMVRQEFASLPHAYGTTGRGLYGLFTAFYHRTPAAI
jgi:hypothetical protein